MKKYIYLLLFSLPLLAASCSKDNYDEPQETFRGKFIDKQTGEPFQTAIGNTGIRIRMMEYSWSDNPQPYDMNVKMDGTFNNTKVFKGEYGITPSGAFVPLEEERIKISGTVEKTWEVEPLLRVEYGQSRLSGGAGRSMAVREREHVCRGFQLQPQLFDPYLRCGYRHGAVRSGLYHPYGTAGRL